MVRSLVIHRLHRDIMLNFKLLISILIFHQISCNSNDLKPVLRELSLPRNLQEGKFVSIHCHVDNPNSSTVNFEWFFNNQKLVQSDNIQITDKEDVSTLKIKSLSLANAGQYKCTVHNQFGNDEQKVNVLFNGKCNFFCCYSAISS